MPLFDQELILPGEYRRPLRTNDDLAEWVELFDPKNPTGIAAVLNLGDSISSGRVPVYFMDYENKELIPLNPVDMKGAKNFSELLDTPVSWSFSAAYNNGLFVPTEDGKLVQVSIDKRDFKMDYTLSKPIENSGAFSAPERPSIWKYIFYFIFSDEISHYNEQKEWYEALQSADMINSFIESAQDGAQKIAAGKPEEPKPAAIKEESVADFLVKLNKLAFTTVDWAVEALKNEECTVGEYCNAVAKNLEAKAAMELLKRAKDDPDNANKILSEAQKPFKNLRKGLMVFVRKDMNLERVREIIEDGGINSSEYPDFVREQMEYGDTALERYQNTLAKEFEGRSSNVSKNEFERGSGQLESKPLDIEGSGQPVLGQNGM